MFEEFSVMSSQVGFRQVEISSVPGTQRYATSKIFLVPITQRYQTSEISSFPGTQRYPRFRNFDLMGTRVPLMPTPGTNTIYHFVEIAKKMKTKNIQMIEILYFSAALNNL